MIIIIICIFVFWLGCVAGKWISTKHYYNKKLFTKKGKQYLREQGLIK